ncbi:MAG: ATP-binding cassette domain-containing protein [Streptosporangiaceae bacterium]
MFGYLRLEISRAIRDVRYLVLALAAPVGFYLLFAGIFSGQRAQGGGPPASVEVMVAMAAFGAQWGALSATAPRLASDRERGWLDVLAVTPLSAARVMAARICAALLASLPAVIAVGVTGRLAHDVQLTAGQWGVGLVAVWLGVLPFVLLGIAIGTTTSTTTAYGVSMGAYFALAALGGLWVPPAIFPATLRQVAMALPSYNQADLGWRIAAGSAPSLRSVLVLAAWTAGLALLAYWAGARPSRAGSPSVPGPADVAARLADVSKHFGAVPALDKLSLDLPPASVVALLGANGAGKTTAIRIMLGLLGADGGYARLFGVRPADAIAAGQVGAMLQDAELMSGVTVRALLRCIAGLYPQPADPEEVIRLTGLAGIGNRRTDRLSTGQAQRVCFAVAMVGKPALLVLDEPTAGLDVQAQQAFWQGVLACRAGGQTVLFSTHYLEEADQNADRIVVIRAGTTVADGTPEQVRAAGGSATIVSFTWLGDPPSGLDGLPGVTTVEREGQQIRLHTTDPDSTVWSLYDQRQHITGLTVTGGGLRAAFLALTGAQ